MSVCRAECKKFHTAMILKDSSDFKLCDFVHNVRERPDMMSALEGSGCLGKADVVREVA